MNAKLTELLGKRDAAIKRMQPLYDEIEKAGRPLTDDERHVFDAAVKEVDALSPEIKRLTDDEELMQRIKDLGAGMDGGKGADEIKASGFKGGDKADFAERFFREASVKSWSNRKSPGGDYAVESKIGVSDPVIVKGAWKELITGESSVSAGAFVTPYRVPGYESLGRQPLSVLDLFTTIRIATDYVEMVRETATSTVAAPVAESNVTTYSGATGEVSGQKPEGTFRYEVVGAPVRTIPAWVPMTTRAMADVPQMLDIIRQGLAADCRRELQYQTISGDGAGQNMTGVLSTPYVLTQAFDTNRFRTVRLAKLAVRTIGLSEPNAIVMHPNDWAEIELTQDGQQRYYGNGPFGQGPETLWGTRVVQSTAVAEGQAIIADWALGYLFNREDVVLRMTDSHSDFFIRNMVAVLAELRATLMLRRPQAFCIIDLEAGS